MNKINRGTFLLLTSLLMISFAGGASVKPRISKKLFGETAGQQVYQYTLTSSNGMQVKVISYGASITDIITADKNGNMGSVVFGFDSLSAYTGRQNALMGAVVGRVANRIAGGKFILDGREYKLTSNIHGGRQGFDKKIWKVEEITRNKEVALKMNYFSKDGEEGFPGNLSVSITYTLTNRNELKIDYTATTDKTTHVNLTNHSYFNLSGGKAETVADTELRIVADQYLEADKNNIPTGNIPGLKGTPLDFTAAQPIGKRIAEEHPALKIGNGYDLTYVLRNQSGKLKLAAQAYEPLSGRVLEAFTTEPGLVFYTGNHLNPGIIGRRQKPSVKYAAFCLETQHYPNSPNQPSFPSTVLRPGETFRSQTIFRFSVRN
ncbi:MAG TPA: aldose epimerase family protein [Pedobacter sp.]|uniref:aldose epimerase family protein n=1 Tax=Pedobacter sp. TaxID=1411316 RepID=UPI002C6BBD83|nr:aldose epimerase family protein [Pedobacter sp.]HMI05497.1 aldose epimerase family protein [Pedobacter sp.]